MHPYHWHWHRPSRLLWFVIGAVSAGWFIKAKETHRFRAAHCPRQQIPADGFTQQAPNPPVYQQQQQQGSLPPSAQSADVVVPVSRPEGQPPVPLPQYDQHRDPRSRGWGWGQGWNPSGESGPASGASSPFTPERWDEERKQMHDIRKQAQETVSSHKLLSMI